MSFFKYRGSNFTRNIYITEDMNFPVLMGGWTWINDKKDEIVAEPITIIFE